MDLETLIFLGVCVYALTVSILYLLKSRVARGSKINED